MENDWDVVRNDRGWTGGAGMGVLRITLLFASAAVALALIVAPIADGRPARTSPRTACRPGSTR